MRKKRIRAKNTPKKDIASSKSPEKGNANNAFIFFVDSLKQHYNLNDKDIITLIESQKKALQKKKDEVLIPVSIFNNQELSALEAITKYLKENLFLTYHQIAVLLNRDDRSIWTTYNNSCRKTKKKFAGISFDITIPSLIFKNRRISVLENIVYHLKENYGLTYHNIALLLRRDDRTVWTVYNRATKKIKNE